MKMVIILKVVRLLQEEKKEEKPPTCESMAYIKLEFITNRDVVLFNIVNIIANIVS